MPTVQVKSNKNKGEAPEEATRHTLVSVHMHVDQKEAFRAKADQLGQSLSGFFIHAAEKSMTEENKTNQVRAIEAENRVLKDEIKTLRQRIQALLEEKAELTANQQVLSPAQEELLATTEDMEPYIQRQGELEWEMGVVKEALRKMSEYIKGRDKAINMLLAALNQKQVTQAYEERRRHEQNALHRPDQEFYFPPQGTVDFNTSMQNAAYYRQMNEALAAPKDTSAALLDQALSQLFSGELEPEEQTFSRSAELRRRAGL